MWTYDCHDSLYNILGKDKNKMIIHLITLLGLSENLYLSKAAWASLGHLPFV